jgi:hypothetical protein
VRIKKERGGVVNHQNAMFPEPQGFSGELSFPEPRIFPEPRGFPESQSFTTEDVLWAVGIWSVILCFSPVIVFYMLMVA